MKKFTLPAVLCLNLVGCSFMNRPPVQVNQNLQHLPAGTQINVVALVPMDVPNASQPKIVNSSAFRVANEVRDPQNATLVVPQNALISAVYTNDGKSCQISWQVVYNNYQSMEKDQGAMGIATEVNNSSCDPKLGIRPGQLFTITFNK